MPTDDLNTPLGQDKPKPARKFPVAMPQLLAGVLALSGLLVVGWAAVVHDPLGGEPVATVPTRLQTASKPDAAGEGGHGPSRYDGPPVTAPDDKAAADAKAAAAAKAAQPPAGSQTVTIIDGSSGKRQDVVIPGNAGTGGGSGAGGSTGATGPRSDIDQKLLETTRHGAIPKVAPDGARASVVYAKPRDLPANRKDSPRIAIIVGGLGISASGTADAFGKLPAAVTFAIAPYGADLQKLAENARADRHEVMLQVPMEPFDYPDNDPGPQTLLTSLSGEQNTDRLHWLMSRFQGYVGVVSYMGARFTASDTALMPILRDTAKRGLIYVDDGASPRSIAGQIAGSHSLPFAKADVVLDTVATPVEIDRALARLEMTARDNGTAVGLATAQPGTIARIAEWAKKVEGRGFLLVPISMVAAKAKSS